MKTLKALIIFFANQDNNDAGMHHLIVGDGFPLISPIVCSFSLQPKEMAISGSYGAKNNPVIIGLLFQLTKVELSKWLGKMKATLGLPGVFHRNVNALYTDHF